MKQLLLIYFTALSHCFFSQYPKQYFDGADTIPAYTLQINLAYDTNSVWQIGKPRKNYFNAAFSTPNVLVTDTLNSIPLNDTSSFTVKIAPSIDWGIFALRWVQKLDMEKGVDGAIIEISIDSMFTWTNVISSPFVYNFYGFQTQNLDTLNSENVLSGRDTLWRDIWLCYDLSWMSLYQDRVFFRFTQVTGDGMLNQKDGWMIDNMMSYITNVHTINEIESNRYFSTFPNPSNEGFTLMTHKANEFQIIEHMELITLTGEVIQVWNNIPTKFYVDTRDYLNGSYFLKIKTNLKSESIPIQINHIEKQ